VFPEGAFIYNGQLKVYYGAEDKYIAAAQINMDELLTELIKYSVPKMP
jgi:beta-1,2-mannobiose phosphorylase / 1,2-beta-oligomannan phosphorylase